MSEPIQSIAQNNYILQAPPPTATMFTTELEYDGDKISGYAGSAFKAGTDLEFGYDSADNISAINNSALTDVNLNNIVQTNSGAWGGSALPISAGPGVKFEMVNDTLVASTDETVLWSGNCAFGTSLTTNEPVTAFERYKVYLRNTERQQQTVIERFADPTINTAESNKIVTLECLQAGWSNNTFLTFNVGNGAWNNSWTTFNYSGGYAGYWYDTSWNHLALNSSYLPVIQKIVGINHK